MIRSNNVPTRMSLNIPFRAAAPTEWHLIPPEGPGPTACQTLQPLWLKTTAQSIRLTPGKLENWVYRSRGKLQCRTALYPLMENADGDIERCAKPNVIFEGEFGR